MKALLIVTLFFCFKMSAQEIYTTEKYHSKPLEIVQTAEIGSSIFETGITKIYEAIKIDFYPNKESYLGTEIKISEGDILVLEKIDEKGKVFYDKDENKYQGVLIVNEDFDHPKLFTHNPTLHPLSRKIQLKVSKAQKKLMCTECLKQEFIYNGKSGNTLKFTYREYINDMARPAFSQELQYDSTEGSTIGFKGLRIEVIKTTNTEIVYKLAKAFNE